MLNPQAIFLEVIVAGESWGIYSRKAYDELRLQMSSGDFGAHVTRPALPLPGEKVTRYKNIAS